MKRSIKALLLTITSLLVMASCMDSYMGVEQVVTDHDSPDKLTVNKVVPKAGALEIHFSLPQGDPNIAQVIATYLNKRGEEVEFKVSRYSSKIIVEGFTGTDEKTVDLFCVDASGNRSENVLVHASPLLSPVEAALNTMEVVPTFGGVKVEWENKEAQPFAIHVLTEDVLQVGVTSLVEDPTKTIYNRDSTNTLAYIRQYPPTEQQFGFVISDKWGNRTDTLLQTLTPYREERIEYERIKAVAFFNPTLNAGSRDYGVYGVSSVTGIQNDANAHGAAYVPQTIFNNDRGGNQLYVYKFVKNLSDPDQAKRELINDVYVTFDLNMEVQLSRVVIFPRVHISYTYSRSSPKRFRIWGTDDSNNERWSKFPEGWTMVGEYVGPDPASPGNPTPEEVAWFNETQEYSIIEGNVNPEANPSANFRYMRLQLMESYIPTEAYYTINELEMYGVIQQVF